MFKKIKDFISNHKTACLGIFLGFLCLVAIFLPKYLQNRRLNNAEINADSVVYDFENDEAVSSLSPSSDSISNGLNIEPVEGYNIDLSNEDELLNGYKSLFINFNKEYFLSSYYKASSFTFSNNADIILDYLSNYSDFNFEVVNSNLVRYSGTDSSVDVNISLNDKNKIVDLNFTFNNCDYLSNLNLASLSVKRALNSGSCFESMELEGAKNIYYDDVDKIYYIIDDETVITNIDTIHLFTTEQIDYISLKDSSKALGLTYESLTGNKAEVSSTDEAVSENVSSEEVEN